MKREKLNILQEKDLLVGLITSDRFCQDIIPVLTPRLLQIDYSRIIANWIKEYFSKFDSAPGKDILKIYRTKCSELNDEDLQENILSFIENLNDNYEKLVPSNVDYAISQSISYLKKLSLKNLAEEIEGGLASEEVEKAEDVVTKYRHIERGGSPSISILHDSERVCTAFTNESELLFEFSGARGKVIGKIHRGDFISYLSPMKRGKTWHLMDSAIEGMKNGLKVVFVSLEMTEDEMLKRFWTALSGQVMEDTDDVDYPYFEKIDTDSKKCYQIKYKSIDRKAVSVSEVRKKQKSLSRMFRGGDVRLIAGAGWSCEKLDSEIEKLVQSDFIPDEIVIDYADLLVCTKNVDYRNQLDYIWKYLRTMSLKRSCAIFTASQSNREGFATDLSESSVAEDVRKIAHVTCMVGLNQSKTEKKQQIMRLSQLAIRGQSPEMRDALCLQCYSIGRPVLDSHFADEVIVENDRDVIDEDEIEKKRRKR